MIEVEKLVKYYGPHKALDGISFSVQKGEVVGFLGPNGAGKSTTLRIVTSYMPADEGKASVDGRDCFTESMEVRRRIGYLPETTPLYPDMRVREYLSFRGKLRGLDRPTRERRIGYVSERCWLGEFINRPISNLSKGMRQRVGLAEAMLHNPPVLILDEPTVGLDPTQIRETRRLVQDLANDHTVLLSSHILPEVDATCSRIVVVASGKIVASGTVDELKRSVGAGRAVAELRASEADIKSAFERLTGVHQVTTDNIGDGWVRVTAIAADGGDLRVPIYDIAKYANWPLRELRAMGGTLEEFFVRITREQLARKIGAEVGPPATAAA